MTDTARAELGQVARDRRIQLGLTQADLAGRGGPASSATVGKFERAAQGSFSVRTRRQMETALDWPNGAVDRFVDAVEKDPTTSALLRLELLHWSNAEVGGRRRTPSNPRSMEDRVTEAFRLVLDLVPPDDREEAATKAMIALTSYLSRDDADTAGISSITPSGSYAAETPLAARRVAAQPGLARQADEQDADAHAPDPEGPEEGA